MLKIKDKAEELGVSIATLRRWHKKGLLYPDFITYGGHRRYKKQTIQEERKIVGYSRVSSSDQKEDLARQSIIIQQSCVDDVIQDIGSGINFNKKGFKSLLSLIFSGKVKEIKWLKKIVYYVSVFRSLNDYVLILM